MKFLVSTKLGSLNIVCVQLGPRKLSVLRSSRVSAIQELLLSIEVNGKTDGTFRIVCYIVFVCCWVVYVKWGTTVFHSHLFLDTATLEKSRTSLAVWAPPIRTPTHCIDSNLNKQGTLSTNTTSWQPSDCCTCTWTWPKLIWCRHLKYEMLFQ